jgi:hypothetical protein
LYVFVTVPIVAVFEQSVLLELYVVWMNKYCRRIAKQVKLEKSHYRLGQAQKVPED